MNDVSTDGVIDRGTRWPRLLTPWLSLVLTASSVLGLIWGGIYFFSGIASRDITVVLQDTTDFALPKDASALKKLRMTYGEKPVENVSLVRLEIINTGSQPIEPPKEASHWTLAIKSKNKSPLEQVGELIKPQGLDVSVLPGGSEDVLHLRIPALKVRESIGMQVAVIGGAQRIYPVDAVDVGPRISDLKVEVTRHSVRNRIANAFLPPVMILSVAVLLVLVILDLRGKKGIKISNVMAMLAMTGLASVFFAGFISWGLAWIVYFIALR
jgi:hypothetical protein